MIFWGSPKGTPHDRCRRTMKKTILQWKPMELGGVPQKIDEYFFWWPIFYVCSSARNWVSSMYKGIYNIRNSLWGVSWMSEVPKLERFNKKTVSPKWSISFYIVLKKLSSSSSPKGNPHDRCRRTMKKTFLQWKPMELGGVPQKIDEYFFWGPIFYVCNSSRNWVSFMYKGFIIFKGIHYIRNSLWGVATLDVWSSSTRTFQPKKPVPRNHQFLFMLSKNMSFSGSPKGTPHDRCRRTMKKKYFAMKTNGIGWCSSKDWCIFFLVTYILCM